MDHGAAYARRRWGKSVQDLKQRVCTNKFKTTAGRPDRPALEEDTLSGTKSDAKNHKSRL